MLSLGMATYISHDKHGNDCNTAMPMPWHGHGPGFLPRLRASCDLLCYIVRILLCQINMLYAVSGCTALLTSM